MSNQNYKKWPTEVKRHYDKTKKDIDTHGHSIKAVIGGKHDKRPFAYTVGASLSQNFEYGSFFPIKKNGILILSNVINKIIELTKNGDFKIKSQIINNQSIYSLPVAMYILTRDEKDIVESLWFNQLERDGFLSEFSTDNHKLAVLIFTDKNGCLPWNSNCENFWPDICPLPILAAAQYKITGDNTLLTKLEEKIDANCE